jgi:SAM-dependent methyltransferase
MPDSFWGKARGVLFGRRRAHPPVHGDVELLRRTDEFNRNAEKYWVSVGSQPTGRQHILNRPLAGWTAAVDVYRVGLLLAELRLGPGLEVLDFGAGSCWLSAFFNRMGCRTVSVDVSEAALDLGQELFAMDARQRPELAPEFLVYDGRRLPVGDASVDRIACFDAFHHIPNQAELLAEMFRVLRSGGRAVLAEPGEGHSHAETSLFEEQVFEVLENDFDILEVERRARAAGFSDVWVKPYLDVAAEPIRPSDYVRLGGLESMLDVSALRAGVGVAQALRSGFRSCAIVVLCKGAQVRDSRSPGRLQAALSLPDAAGPVRGLVRTTLAAVLRVVNTGDTVWRHGPAGTPGNVEVGAHLLSAAHQPIHIDYLRAPLPRAVAPGDTIDVPVALRIPEPEGSYVLRFDLVAEGVCWFNQVGSPFLELPLEVFSTEDEQAYRAAISLPEPVASLRAPAGSRLALGVRLENRGLATWPFAAELAPGTFRLGAQLLDDAGRLIDLDGARAALPQQVLPGEACDVTLRLRLPASAGCFRLKLDLVQERVCWFEQRGSQPCVVDLEATDEPTDSARPGVLLARFDLQTPVLSVTATPGQTIPILARVKNLGNTRWLGSEAGARGQVRLGARLAGPAGTHDYWRAQLAEDVEPGATTEIEAEMPAPQEPGTYLVTLDLVAEGFAWFQDEGSRAVSFALHVVEGQPAGVP